MTVFGLAEGDLKVIVHDVPFENWGLKGQPADPAKISFRVDVLGILRKMADEQQFARSATNALRAIEKRH